MSAPVLDTMISHMRTARNRTLQSEKLSLNGVFDHLEPRVSILVSPSTTRRSCVDSEGSACSSRRFADEGHMSCRGTSRVMRLRGLLKQDFGRGSRIEQGGGRGGGGGGRLQAKDRRGDGGRTGGGGRGADGKGGGGLGGLRGYQMDDKMMSKPVLVRRELGQGCAVVT